MLGIILVFGFFAVGIVWLFWIGIAAAVARLFGQTLPALSLRKWWADRSKNVKRLVIGAIVTLVLTASIMHWGGEATFAMIVALLFSLLPVSVIVWLLSPSKQ